MKFVDINLGILLKLSEGNGIIKSGCTTPIPAVTLEPERKWGLFI